MATWTPEQFAGAGNWLSENIGNPELVNQEMGRLGISQSDLLQAARTQNPNIQADQVAQYTGYQSPQAQQGGRIGASMNPYQRSPYLDQMAARITQQSGQALNEQALPGIRSQAVASGGYGGSRQGIAEGLAIGRSNEALQGTLANLYNTDYQADRNRAMQQYGIDQQTGLGYGQLDAQNRGIDNQYTLGLGQLGLGNRQADNQRYGIDQTYNLGMTNADNQRYGTDKSYEVGMAGANASMANAQASQAQAAGNLALGQQQLGLNGLFGVLDRQYQYGQGAQNTANTMQNTPMNYWQQFGQGANSLGQSGGTSMTTGTQANNPYASALGGAQLANAWYNQSGNGNIGGTAANTQNWTYGGNASAPNPAGNIDYIYGG